MLRSIQEKGEVKAEKVIMTEVHNKKEIWKIGEGDLKDHHTEAVLSLDKILGEEISEGETKEISGTTTDLTGVKEGQETGSFQEM